METEQKSKWGGAERRQISNAEIRRMGEDFALSIWDILLILLIVGSAVYLFLTKGVDGIIDLAVTAVFLATVVGLILKILQRQSKMDKYLESLDKKK